MSDSEISPGSEPSLDMPSRSWNKESLVFLEETADGWEATQQGVDVIGTGDTAARATEDMARKIAEAQERGEL